MDPINQKFGETLLQIHKELKILLEQSKTDSIELDDLTAKFDNLNERWNELIDWGEKNNVRILMFKSYADLSQEMIHELVEIINQKIDANNR